MVGAARGAGRIWCPGIELQPLNRVCFTFCFNFDIRVIAGRQVVQVQDDPITPRGVTALAASVLPPETEGIERLHRQVSLVYRYRDSKEEKLHLGAELFHLLLELANGYPLGDVSTDDSFANLSIFVQRLVREDERQLLAWNPMQDERLYRIAAVIRDTPNGVTQRLEISSITAEARS